MTMALIIVLDPIPFSFLLIGNQQTNHNVVRVVAIDVLVTEIKQRQKLSVSVAVPSDVEFGSSNFTPLFALR
jgi:hypothetical protein